ncbi:MptD family putative ECF transporter S component [Gemella cuniculi]|uniref:MptD family putative ECF transporter S component n=1 Tax=Gemella cuniculi TaxID=150240 RepID=UPI0003F6A2A2|nr:MptD family putative ECF transporter S component [Gemella cuniculi]
MNNKLKIKDILLIALLTAVYLVIYFFSMLIITPLGALGHAISPGINGLFTGTIIYFMVRKIGKMWQFSLFTLFAMGIFSLMGGGYLPWLITSMTTAIIADLIASRSKDTPVFKIAIAAGLMHMGQAWGAIIPAMFFLNSYRETWVKRGETVETMNEYIKYTSSYWGVISSIIVFILGIIGVYVGYAILKKHFKEA